MRVHVVTGASGGLGGAVARALLEAGGLVIAVSGHHPVTITHPNCHPIPLDLESDSAMWIPGVQSVLDSLGGALHSVVHAAGVISDGLLVQTDVGEWDRVMSVNLAAGMALCRWAIPKMIEQGIGGHLVLVGSNSGQHGSVGQSAYSASKAALGGMMRALAREVGPYGICCNLVLPGFLETRMTAPLAAGVLEKYRSAHVLGKFTTPQESAGFISHLILHSSSVSGQTFQLDSRLA